MGAFARLQNLAQAIFSPEKLEDAPEVAATTSRVSLFGLLTGRERLAEDPHPQDGKEGLLAVLLRPEALPLDAPAPASGRHSFLGSLVSRERLPEGEAPPGGRV